jgi:hypothetical protein
MRVAGIVGGVLVLLVVLWDAFETVVLPRRVSRRLRLARGFYRLTWSPWRALGRRLRPSNLRENLLSIYGPLSLLLLLATWALLLIVGFALIHWGAGSPLHAPDGLNGFGGDLYYSGTTLFTLGLGDVTPLSTAGRVLTVLEGGTGLGFLALILGYLPALTQAFSRREAHISLLDAHAGSPPSAAELLKRHSGPDANEALSLLLAEWERWCADLLETQISFPVLAYYRSQHDNQSWISALTTILDTCTLIMAGVEGAPTRAARLTFAIGRHASVDLCNLFGQRPAPAVPDRLPPPEVAELREALAAVGLPLRDGPEVDEKLHRLRQMYEPYLNALGQFLLMPLPSWLSHERAADNWERMR